MTNSDWFFALIEVQTLGTVGPCCRCICGNALGGCHVHRSQPLGRSSSEAKGSKWPAASSFSAILRRGLSRLGEGPRGRPTNLSFTNNCQFFSVHQLVFFFFSTSTFASFVYIFFPIASLIGPTFASPNFLSLHTHSSSLQSLYFRTVVWTSP